MNGKKRMVEQSKTWLVDAFLDLLKTQPYDSITVKDISEKAQLSRRTFYRLFKDKNDLLNFYSDRLIKEYLARLQTISSTNMQFEQVLRIFFEFWWSKRTPVRLLIHQNLFMSLLDRMNPTAFRLYDLFDAPWHVDGNQREISYIMSFSVGGFWNVLNMWLKKDDQDAQSPEVIANILSHAIKKLQEKRQ
ncbi:TetR/AcrR family transcriptional regulator [Lentilactobacillus hilgardii]|uniref:TetR/AcrR family transcriptional regulator n=1 Tax=Lentilactobacillus hilgardii TaxID=1588 RepID=UPI0021A360DF|nr:TetR/AcrR family transcriptional regulator [Lentilactobacillus hilgardii]MCT3399580.1 TetR/AcrR family transcriptional regulator [Lentilactobacillus hilgardii]